MDILGKAKQRAILPIENGYVFNDIYFSTTQGLTSASASHVSAMANVMAQDVKAQVKALRLYRKFIRVIGEDEVLVEDYNDTLVNLDHNLNTICKANALIAWLREGIKEKEMCIDLINATTLEEYCERYHIDLGEEPVMPKMPRVNFNDLHVVLATGVSIKEYNRLLELNSTLAVYGELIHDKGLLTEHKRKLQAIAKNPIEYAESGRDTIITRYEAKAINYADAIYTQLQAQYRKLQAEKNGLEAKFADLAADYQVNLKHTYDEELAKYRRACEEYELRRAEANSAMTDWKKAECDRVAALKIIIPNDLTDIYEELKRMYL